MKNFAKISTSFLLQTDKVLRVSDAETGTAYARADITEEFPMEFPIADINMLLNVLSLAAMKECSIKFIEEDAVNMVPKHLVITGGNTSIRFFSSAMVTVDLPPQDPEMPDDSIEFKATVPSQTWNDFTKACSTLGLSHCTLSNENGYSYLIGSDPTIDNSDDYVVKLEKTELGDVEIPLLVNMCKFIESESYDISACRAFAKVSNKGGAINYFISAEQL